MKSLMEAQMTKWRRSRGTHVTDVSAFMSGTNMETIGLVTRRLPKWRRWSGWNVPLSALSVKSR
jgi:hypothetical protein